MVVKLDKPLNDGLMEYGKYKTVRNSSGKKTGQQFTVENELFFDYATIRQTDSTFYENIGKTVDKKIKTYYLPGVENSVKVKVDGDFYDVETIDVDYQQKYMYWYLAKVGAENG